MSETVVRSEVEAPQSNHTGANGLAKKSDGDKGALSMTKLPGSSSRKYKHIFPIHAKIRPSALSHDAEQIPSFLGVRNLVVLSLVVSNLRLVVENFNKYGVLICVRCHDYRRQDVRYGLLLFLLVPAQLFIAYLIESIAARQAKAVLARAKRSEDGSKTPTTVQRQRIGQMSSWTLIAFAHSFNATLNLMFASYMVYYHVHHPGIGTLVELNAVIVWLKTCSYALTNRDLRHALLEPSFEETTPAIYKSRPYPSNVTLPNLLYFWWAPTLVYQPVYPRTERVRWSFVAKRLAEVVVLSITIWILSAQYASPLLVNSIRANQTGDIGAVLERLMKLSTVSLICWLAGFFALFHSYLNALAEVLRFGDREFYTDWWNATTIRDYWTMWNKPVYTFMKRHIYIPLVGRGCPAPVAQVVVFIYSGALHELVVGVPTHNIIGMAFGGMLAQIPLIFITDYIVKWQWCNGKLMGNLFFWISFCIVGQPLAAMSYFWAWQAKFGSVGKPHVEG